MRRAEEEKGNDRERREEERDTARGSKHTSE